MNIAANVVERNLTPYGHSARRIPPSIVNIAKALRPIASLVPAIPIHRVDQVVLPIPTPQEAAVAAAAVDPAILVVIKVVLPI